jgi:hypothetical protein
MKLGIVIYTPISCISMYRHKNLYIPILSVVERFLTRTHIYINPCILMENLCSDCVECVETV